MYKAKHFDAIIFDLGGVIIDIDYQLTINSFESLGVKNFNKIFSKEQQLQFSDQYERGEISTPEFIKNIQELGKINASMFMMKKAWNAMLQDIPRKRLELCARLKEKMPTFVLSNTNQEHIKRVNDYLLAEYNVPSLNPFFKKVYLSHEIGKRKPENRAWQQILDENNLTNPKKVLFIDDSPQHIEAAKKLNITCHHLNVKKEDIVDLIKL